MTNEEYGQKKQECWEEYTRKCVHEGKSAYGAFNFAFDRAYALGKQDISAKPIESESMQLSDVKSKIDEWMDSHTDEKVYEALKKYGAIEDSEDTVIQGWVARDDGERWHERELHLFTHNKPERRKLMGDWIGRSSMMLDSSLFPDLTWSDEPRECEIIIKRKKNG